MSVVGIDLGGQSTKIGVARNKGIDIVRINCPSAQFPGGKSRICADSGLFFSSPRSPTRFPADLLRMFPF